jgi:hypothetical protein
MSNERERIEKRYINQNSNVSPRLMRLRNSSSAEWEVCMNRDFNLRGQLLRELDRLRSIMAGEGDPYKKMFKFINKRKATRLYQVF